MRVVAVAAIVLAARLIQVYSCKCGWVNDEESRIVGGENARPGQFPWMANLVSPEWSRYVWDSGENQWVHSSIPGHMCGAGIITEYHLLTAGHCMAKMTPQKVSVVLGDWNWNEENSTPWIQRVNIKQIIQYPGFYEDSYGNSHKDISIILLETPIKFNKHVGPACMPPPGLNLEGQKIRCMGWGNTSFDANTDPGITILQTTELDVVPFDECSAYWGLNPDRSQVCLDNTENRGLYVGDSGSPNSWKDPSSGLYAVAAITSFSGVALEGGRHPYVLTNVSFYLDWIQQIVEETRPSDTVKLCSLPTESSSQSSESSSQSSGSSES